MTVIVRVPDITQPTEVAKLDEHGKEFCIVLPGEEIALGKGEALILSGIVLRYVQGGPGYATVLTFGEDP